MYKFGRKGSLWDLHNETSKAGVRWFLVAGIGIYLGWILSSQGGDSGVRSTLNLLYVGSLLSVTISLNLILHLFLLKRSRGHHGIGSWIKYVTMIYDLCMVTFLLLPTGGKDSMFFFVYFIIILSNGIRYGMRLSVIALSVFNLLYVLALVFQFYPDLVIPDFQREALKVIGVWFVGIYTGYLSRRFEVLQNEVEHYRKLIKSMTQDQSHGSQ